jgi:hypothetical protein
VKRYKHNLSHYNLLTCDMGELVPVGFQEVLPGDSGQIATSVFMRVSPLIAPVMHPVTCRVHHVYVPYRLLANELGFDWEAFITGGPNGTGAGAPLPTITTTVTPGQPLDYMGIPPTAAPTEILAFPLAAYNKAYNDLFRDQDTATERALDDESMARIAWEKDYFTGSRPWPQKGPEVTLPLGTSAPVVGSADQFSLARSSSAGTVSGVNAQPDGSMGVGAGASIDGLFGPDSGTGLLADLTSATAASVTDLRTALAIQRYQEARSRYGSRFTEYLRYLGVRSSDARLQRAELLGGGKSVIAFSEVLNTSSSLNDPDSALDDLGRMGGHGVAAMRSRPVRRFFEEHGCVLSLLSVRPRSMYTQGIHRSWLRRTKEDFWQKELEHIGQQPVDKREVYADADVSSDTTFGYHDRYFEYRNTPNRISGDFRSTLNFWHLGREFSAEPVLNQSFTDCNPSKRIYAEQTQDSLWIMAKNIQIFRRLVGRSAMPRIY